MRSLFLIAFLLGSFFNAIAGGKITGKVTDEKNGESIIGAVVMIKGTTIGSATDIDGNFIITADTGTYTIEVKYIGYQTKEISDIKVENGKETAVNITIGQAKATELKEVVIKSSLKKENISAMITFQKNTNTVAQVVSAEAIRKSPDRNTGEVLKRVSSASIQEGKYLVVRGLADRYNQATLNGALLSSTEPDRKTFSFDLFPSGMIDNIVINKAATPDLPGEFAGGLVQVNTKDVPSKNFATIQVGSGANMQTLGKDFNYYQGGKLDWLGIDDGTRALPSSIPDKDHFRSLSKAQRIALSKELPNNWGYQTRTGAPNANLQASGGVNTKVLNGKTLGVVGAVSYNKQNRNTQLTRAFYNQSDSAVEKSLDFKEQMSTQEILWGALANVTLDLNPNNKISLKTLYNLTSLNSTQVRSGRNNDYGADVEAFQQAFKSTGFFNTQLAGTHFLEKSKTKVNWNVAYVNLHQNQPALRRLEYRRADGDSTYTAVVPTGLPALNTASMFYSDLTDHIVNGNFDAAKQFKFAGRNHTFKFGYMGQVKSRAFNSRPFGMVGSNYHLIALPANQLFTPENMNDTGFQLNELSDKDYDYTAYSRLHAGFAMLDNMLSERFRIVWGIRYENFNQVLMGFRSNRPVNVDRTVGDFLPSFNLTYKPTEKANIRLCGSQTVIRPEFRELAPFAFFDFEVLATTQGNPDLQRTKISNLDLRYELYPRSGEMFTVGTFYKYFVNPIEQFYNESGANTFSFTYNNATSANTYGVEAEFRKRLDFIAPTNNTLGHFTAFANVSYIRNNVNFEVISATGEKTKADRPMQGQSPYVINGGIQYESEKTGTSVTGLFNMIGRRIFLVGNNENPNIWEAPRPLLDFQVSQKLLKDKAGIKLSVTDILNKTANFYQDMNENGKYDANKDFLRISKVPGTNVSLSFIYNL